jgi:hypothetical protein
VLNTGDGLRLCAKDFRQDPLRIRSWRVAETINPKTNLGAAYAGFACAGLE